MFSPRFQPPLRPQAESVVPWPPGPPTGLPAPVLDCAPEASRIQDLPILRVAGAIPGGNRFPTLPIHPPRPTISVTGAETVPACKSSYHQTCLVRPSGFPPIFAIRSAPSAGMRGRLSRGRGLDFCCANEPHKNRACPSILPNQFWSAAGSNRVGGLTQSIRLPVPTPPIEAGTERRLSSTSAALSRVLPRILYGRRRTRICPRQSPDRQTRVAFGPHGVTGTGPGNGWNFSFPEQSATKVSWTQRTRGTWFDCNGCWRWPVLVRGVIVKTSSPPVG